MNFSLAAKLGLALTIIVLLLQTTLPFWSEHLQTDVNVYFWRVQYLVEHGNFTKLSGNEYQPGALFFFALLSPILLLKNSADSFTLALFIVNIFLIGALALLYFRFGDGRNILLFSLILLLSGPIVFYRFELFVMVLVVFSLYLWQKKHALFWSALFLGLATMVKVFPIVLLPYYCLIAYKNKNLPMLLSILSGFAIGFGGFLLLFMLVFQAPLSIFSSSLVFLRSPVHTESLWGVLLTLIPKLTAGIYAKGAGSLGIFGIAPEFQIGPLWFYNNFWILPMSLFYLWYSKSRQTHDLNLDLRIVIGVILLFLTFAKILHHQYTLWFMLLLPLLNIDQIFKNSFWVVNIFVILVMSLLHQYIYPLNFYTFIGEFYTYGTREYLFWMIVARNVLLVWVCLRIVINVLYDQQKVN